MQCRVVERLDLQRGVLFKIRKRAESGLLAEVVWFRWCAGRQDLAGLKNCSAHFDAVVDRAWV